MDTFFQWTMNTGNYSSLSNQKGANLCLKCTKIRLAAGLCPDLLEELMGSPRPPSRNGGLLLRGTEGRREGTETEGKGIPPKVRVSGINVV